MSVQRSNFVYLCGLALEQSVRAASPAPLHPGAGGLKENGGGGGDRRGGKVEGGRRRLRRRDELDRRRLWAADGCSGQGRDRGHSQHLHRVAAAGPTAGEGRVGCTFKNIMNVNISNVLGKVFFFAELVSPDVGRHRLSRLYEEGGRGGEGEPKEQEEGWTRGELHFRAFPSTSVRRTEK